MPEIVRTDRKLPAALPFDACTAGTGQVLFLRIRVKSLCRLKKDMEEKNKKTSGIKEADPVMPDPEKIIRNAEADTEDIVDFMHEEIKKRPVNRRKFLRQARETVGIAVIFGVVSCIVFAIGFCR